MFFRPWSRRVYTCAIFERLARIIGTDNTLLDAMFASCLIATDCRAIGDGGVSALKADPRYGGNRADGSTGHESGVDFVAVFFMLDAAAAEGGQKGRNVALASIVVLTVTVLVGVSWHPMWAGRRWLSPE